MTEGLKVIIYTDGACRSNPGPGGWGAVLVYNGREREISGGERWTTNNRRGAPRLASRSWVASKQDSRAGYGVQRGRGPPGDRAGPWGVGAPLAWLGPWRGGSQRRRDLGSITTAEQCSPPASCVARSRNCLVEPPAGSCPPSGDPCARGHGKPRMGRAQRAQRRAPLRADHGPSPPAGGVQALRMGVEPV